MAAADIKNLCPLLNMMMVYQFGHHAGRDRQMGLSQRFRIDIPDALIQEGIDEIARPLEPFVAVFIALTGAMAASGADASLWSDEAILSAFLLLVSANLLLQRRK